MPVAKISCRAPRARPPPRLASSVSTPVEKRADTGPDDPRSSCAISRLRQSSSALRTASAPRMMFTFCSFRLPQQEESMRRNKKAKPPPDMRREQEPEPRLHRGQINSARNASTTPPTTSAPMMSCRRSCADIRPEARRTATARRLFLRLAISPLRSMHASPSHGPGDRQFYASSSRVS